jgi:Flp pilus assembly protein TadG
MVRRQSTVDDEAGLVSTELAVLMPVLIILVLLPIQFALLWHGKQAADLAAEEAVEAAQVVGADPATDGAAGAYAILGQAGNLIDVVVTVTTTTDSVIVDVSGTLDYSILGTYTVTARAEGPLERFIAEVDR